MLTNHIVVEQNTPGLIVLYQSVYTFIVQMGNTKDAERVAESAVESAVAVLVRASK